MTLNIGYTKLSPFTKCFVQMRNMYTISSQKYEDVYYNSLENRTGLRKKDIMDYEEIYLSAMAAEGKDRRLRKSDFQTVVVKMIGKPYNDTDLEKVFTEIDRNRDGRVSFEEFIQHMANKNRPPARKEKLVQVFNMWDKDHDGGMTLHQLKQALFFLGHDSRRESIRSLFADLDFDADNKINLRQFRSIVEDQIYEPKIFSPSNDV